MQTPGRDSRDRNPLMLLGLALVVIGAIGVFFGRLIQAAQIKKQVIESSAYVVGADGLIPEREAELLRAIADTADTLDCPIPPLIQVSEMKGATV